MTKYSVLFKNTHNVRKTEKFSKVTFVVTRVFTAFYKLIPRFTEQNPVFSLLRKCSEYIQPGPPNS